LIPNLTAIPGWQVYVWILAISVPAAIHVRSARHNDRPARYEIVLMYVLGVSGAIGMFNVVVHTVFASSIAESIGWPAGNPFQTEVAFANLAIGTVGFACFWRYDFWLSAAVAKSIFAWGAGLTHVLDMAETGNLAPNNIGPILVWDFLLPVAIIALFILTRPARARVAIAPALYWSTRWRLGAARDASRAPVPIGTASTASMSQDRPDS
jgi:hypothetical protein